MDFSYLDNLTCDVSGTSLVEDGVREAILECLESCGIPAPQMICPTVCEPNVVLQKGKDCCDRLDVWVDESVLQFNGTGRCLNDRSVLTVTVRLTRCAATAVGSDCEKDGTLAAALEADHYVLSELVPAKLAGVGGCCGSIPPQSATFTRLCGPCLGWEVRFRLPVPKPAKPLGSV